jgi:prepilin-type N-terminal cleavage/methylation domain-containing protein
MNPASFLKKKRPQIKISKGQTLIELLIAIAIFVIVVTGLAYFILDSYASGRLAEEIVVANFLAEEGLEAARSIRDNDWSTLNVGEYGLVISGNNWIFSGTEEDISDLLEKGTRKIIIEELGPADPDRKKITSRINWEFTPARLQDVQLVTYFTNFAKTSPYVQQLHYRWRNDDGAE